MAKGKTKKRSEKRATRKKKKAKKKRLRRRTRRTMPRQWELWMPFHVEEVARDKALRAVLPRLLFDWHDWPIQKVPQRRKRKGRYKPYDVRDRHREVEATITIDAYLTDEVPERMRKQVHTIRGPGDALVHAADMYLKVYRANARKGGEPVDPDVDARVAKRRRRAKRAAKLQGKKKAVAPILMNRGFEPYVWGHDLEDLVFEGIVIEWTNADHTKANVSFMIGS